MADYTLEQIQYMARDQANRIVDLSARRSEIHVDDIAKKMIDYHKSKEETRRRDLIKKRKAIVEDRWYAYLIHEIECTVAAHVADAVMGKSERRVDITRNIARDVWKEMSSLYRKPAARSIVGDDKEGTLIKQYNALLDGTHFDLFWPRVEVSLKAYNDVIIYPQIVEHYGKKILRHRLLAGDQVTVLSSPDDPMLAEMVLIEDCYRDLDGKDVVQYHLVTNYFRETYDDDGKRITAPETYDPESPYHYAMPRLPMVFIHANPFASSFFDATTGSDIVDLTVDVGYDATMNRFQKRMSSFKQVLASGNPVRLVEEQTRDTLSFLRIDGEGVSTQVIDWTVDHKSYQELIDAREARAAASRGINPDKLKTAKSNYITIVSARVSERGLLEARQENIPLFVDAEREYFRLVCLLAKAHGMKAPSEDSMINVKHADLEYPEDPSALFALRSNEARMGLISLADLVKEKHPDWTVEQAKQFILDNIEFNASIADIKVRRSIPDDLTNATRDDEQAGTMGPLVRDGVIEE